MRRSKGLFSFSQDQLIGVVNVRLKFGEGFALAHDTWDFDELADIPVSVFPVFECQPDILHVRQPVWIDSIKSIRFHTVPYGTAQCYAVLGPAIQCSTRASYVRLSLRPMRCVS